MKMKFLTDVRSILNLSILYFSVTNSQSIIVAILIPHLSLLPKPVGNRSYFT